MNRAYGSFLIMIVYGNWTKVQPYKMFRADGSEKFESSIGTTNIVATDFNPLVDMMNLILSSLGTIHNLGAFSITLHFEIIYNHFRSTNPIVIYNNSAP